MSSDLFAAAAEARRQRAAPLADRMRPQTLDQYVGQPHILAPGKLLRRAVEADRVTSLILFGPPGTGKTTLARIVANTTRKHFASLNAVLAGVRDIREQVEAAQERLRLHGQGTILFVDEVHRFNKSQQDALLPHVENGTVTFVGATTENPFFEVNKALVSRSRIFELHTLTEDDLRAVVAQTLADDVRGYGGRDVQIDDDALAHLVHTANGDARSLLNALELAVETTEPADGVTRVTLAIAEDSIQQRAVLYDKDGDAHYDTISAFIKSMRGSDPDAALYWMARMIYAGEDPRFVLRRMLIFACEDVGLADPNAVRQAVRLRRRVRVCGDARGPVHAGPAVRLPRDGTEVELGLRVLQRPGARRQGADGGPAERAQRRLARQEGAGPRPRLQVPHAYRDHYVPEQYLPGGMQGTYFYEPSDQGYEARLAARLDGLRQRDAEESIEKRVQRYAADE